MSTVREIHTISLPPELSGLLKDYKKENPDFNFSGFVQKQLKRLLSREVLTDGQ
jgi:hypothetical protein